MRRFSVERSNKRCKRAWSHLIKSSDGGGRDDEDVEYEKSWPSREYALNLAMDLEIPRNEIRSETQIIRVSYIYTFPSSFSVPSVKQFMSRIV